MRSIETIWRSTPEQVAEMRRALPPYWEPIIEAIASHGVAALVIEPSSDCFSMTASVPLITVIADHRPGAADSEGPTQFDSASMVEHWNKATAAVIVAGARTVGSYAAAASVAVLLRRNAILVETQPQHQEEWIRLALYCGIGRLMVVTPQPSSLDIGMPPGGKLN